MIDKEIYELELDPDYEAMHIYSSEKQIKRLEQSIMQRGAVKPLFTWNNTLIDGYKRYKIFHKRGIPFYTQELGFNNRNEALEWLCNKCLLRKDLTEEYKKYFIGKKFLIMSAIDKEVSAKISGSSPQNIRNKYVIAKEVGASHNLAHVTVIKYSQYAHALDTIRACEPLIAKKILTSQIKVSHDNIIEISRLSPDELHVLYDCFNDDNRDHILISEIWHELQWSKVHIAKSLKPRELKQRAEIKNTPQYDPDAELSSLALTIPSWKSCIERAIDHADFAAASDMIKRKLHIQLFDLANKINDISVMLKEADNA